MYTRKWLLKSLRSALGWPNNSRMVPITYNHSRQHIRNHHCSPAKPHDTLPNKQVSTDETDSPASDSILWRIVWHIDHTIVCTEYTWLDWIHHISQGIRGRDAYSWRNRQNRMCTVVPSFLPPSTFPMPRSSQRRTRNHHHLQFQQIRDTLLWLPQ